MGSDCRNGLDFAHAPFVHRSSFGDPDHPEIESFNVESDSWSGSAQMVIRCSSGWRGGAQRLIRNSNRTVTTPLFDDDFIGAF
nr:hypothetical protein [Pseudomonas sp. PP3]